MRAFVLAVPIFFATRVPAAAAQIPATDARLTPISDFRADWLNEGAESPNGRFFVLMSYAGNGLIRYDRTTRQWDSSRVDVGRQIRWAPNGRFITYARRDYVWVLPMDSATGLPSGTARRVTTRSGAASPAWSPDGRQIAFTIHQNGRFSIATVPFNGGDETVIFEGPGRGGDLDWSPDGRFLYAGYAPPDQHERIRIELATKRVTRQPLSLVRTIGLSPDGSRFAQYDQMYNRLAIVSATDGRVLQALRVPDTFQPTGWSRSVPNAIIGVDHITPSTVQRVSPSGGRISSITPVDSATTGDVRFSPDGKQFAYARRMIGGGGMFVANADGTNLRPLVKRGDVGALMWSPSGDRIAYLTRDARPSLRVVDVRTGADRELVAPDTTLDVSIPRLAWRQDGRALRYLARPGSAFVPPRQAREVTLDGRSRVLTAFEGAGSTREGRMPRFADPQFVNDTLLLVRWGDRITSVDLRTGARKDLYNGPIRSRDEIGISPDRKWIAFSAWQGENQVPVVVSLETREARKIPYSLPGELGVILFHPDGRQLVASACTTCNAGVEKWEIVMIPMNGEPPRVLTAAQPSYKDYGSPAISPDGSTIIFKAEQSYNTRIASITVPRN